MREACWCGSDTRSVQEVGPRRSSSALSWEAPTCIGRGRGAHAARGVRSNLPDVSAADVALDPWPLLTRLPLDDGILPSAEFRCSNSVRHGLPPTSEPRATGCPPAVT